jgi:hypothetical protein
MELFMKFKAFKKIESIKQLQKYRLPIPETIFIYNFKKQEKEIDDFLKNKRIVTVRSDKENKTDFCPHNLRCQRKEAKKFVRNLVSKGYAAIVQRYVPIRRDRVSGNILILKNRVLMDLMGTGPLTRLTREGIIEEQVVFSKNGFKRLSHHGKELISKAQFRGILNTVKNIPPYKILEFTLRPEGIYFWQIKEDKSARQLENS